MKILLTTIALVTLASAAAMACNYYPLCEDSVWYFSCMEDPGKTSIWTMTEDSPDMWLHHRVWLEDGMEIATEDLMISSDETGALFMHGLSDNGGAWMEFDPPLLMVMSNLRAGQTWESNASIVGGGSAVAEVECLAVGTVTVPTGAHWAYQLAQQLWFDGATQGIEHIWLVEALGPIRTYNPMSGETYELEAANVCGIVANDTSSWSEVKSLFR